MVKVHTGIFERQAAKFQELARLVFLIKDNIFIFDFHEVALWQLRAPMGHQAIEFFVEMGDILKIICVIVKRLLSGEELPIIGQAAIHCAAPQGQ